MTSPIVPAFRLFAVLTLVTGVAYPALVTVLAKTIFPNQAEGSLISRDGRVVGSSLIAQKFENDRFFWPRPSAVDFNPLPSGGSNLGPTAKKLKDQVDAAKAKFGTDVPQDLVFASASGLDPHISPEAAFHQAARIAKARGLSETQVRALIESKIEDRQWRLFGQPRVNVLELNLALDGRPYGDSP